MTSSGLLDSSFLILTSEMCAIQTIRLYKKTVQARKSSATTHDQVCQMVLEIWLVFPGELLSLPNAILGRSERSWQLRLQTMISAQRQQNETPKTFTKSAKSRRIPISPKGLLLAHDCHTIGHVCNLKTETLMDSPPKQKNKMSCGAAKK